MKKRSTAFALMAFYAIALASCGAGEEKVKVPPVGKTAPELVAQDVDGQTHKLSDYLGKVVVLDFGSYG